MLGADDLIIRYGEDELVCVVSGLNLADVTDRLALVRAALPKTPAPSSVTVGLAEMEPDESPEDLVGRADAALYRERFQRRYSRLGRRH
ncbi:MAG: hypothetical protein QOE93_1222 [Actinomycetota bacterium]|jgi:diguanylate cyclase|nr:hypothetical protein [Actinomycetota bacterium]